MPKGRNTKEKRISKTFREIIDRKRKQKNRGKGERLLSEENSKLNLKL